MASAAAQATKAEGSVMKGEACRYAHGQKSGVSYVLAHTGKQRALVEPLDSTKIHLMLDEEACVS